MKITKKDFGKIPDGKIAELFTLTNNNGMKVDISNYGGIIVSLFVSDKTGNLKDVVLGYNNIENYYNSNVYLGALIGRFANRIENGSFFINGVEYHVALNDNGINHLHGGEKGFNQKLCNAEITNNGLELSYLSKDGEENYPGNLFVKVTYSISDSNELILNYNAVSDKATIINLTNHSYFNLEGHNSGDILNQELWINASSFTQTDKYSIPTGRIISVLGTPMDFTHSKVIGERIYDDYEQLNIARGYDHNWKLNKIDKSVEVVASLYSHKTGIYMEVSTTLPGIQIYSGNYLDNSIDKIGKEGAIYSNHSGICFETQYFPNCMNVPQFENCVFGVNEIYHSTTIFKFSTK